MQDIGLTDEETTEILGDLREFAKESNSSLGDQLKRVQTDLEFAGGNQLDETDRAMRGAGRANVTVHLMRNYCNQVINPYRAKPFGIVINSKTAKSSEKAILTQGIIRGIESKCNGKVSYTTAIDREVKGGRGYVVVTTGYASEDGFDQEIKIEPIINPKNVIYDGKSVKIDGEDQTKGAYVEYPSITTANEVYGLNIQKGERSTNLLDGTFWQCPINCVESITFFVLKKTKTRIYQDEQGNTLSQDKVRKNSKMKNRNTVKTTVICYRIVNGEIVSKTELPLSRIPIVPFLGEMIDTANKTDYVGLVYFGKDQAKLVSSMASLIAERIALNPKPTTYVVYKSIANYKGIWQQSNKLNVPFLPYDHVDENGQPLPAPIPRDATVNVQDLTSSQQSFQSNLSSVMGMSEAGAQAAGAGNETAASVLTRSRSTDFSNYQFLDNAATSIKAVGKVVLEMLNTIYDTPRMMAVEIDGKTEMREIDVSELGIIASEFEVDVDAGPMAATQRKEEQNALIALGSMLGPEVALGMAPEMVRVSEFRNKDKIATILEQIATTKLGIKLGDEAGQDPEAVEALNSAQETITSLETQHSNDQILIQQLQYEVLAQKQLADAEILKAQIGAQNRIDVETMKIQGKMNETQVKIQADAQQATQDAMLDLEKQRKEREANQPVIIAGTEAVNRSVGGMRNQLY